MTTTSATAPAKGGPGHQRVHRGSARSTLLNVLGEFVHPAGGPVPTSALVAALDDAGYERYAARQSVSRCARAGWIAGRREGRASWWELTASGRALLEDGLRRVGELGDEPPPWDGRWLALFISVPQSQRAVRQRLYRSLTWSGLGTPMPGVWLTTHVDRADRIDALVGRLGLRETSVSLVGSASGIGMTDAEIVQRAWDIEGVGRHYDELVGSFGRRRPRTGAGAMRALLELDEELQRLPPMDPRLPPDLLPRWGGRRAAERLLERRAAWLGPARERWAEHGIAGGAPPS